MSNDGAGLSWPAVKQYYSHVSARRHLLPLPDHRLIYVKNPKSGSSTVLVWLDRIHTGDLDFELQRVHQEHRLPTIRDVGRAQVLRMLSGEAYRFSFVREPLRRLESVYRDKMFHDLDFRRKVAPSMDLPADPDVPVTFEQFLDAVEQQDPLTEMNPHWRPQHINLLHPLVAYDHVGRLESFEADLARIQEEAALPRVPIKSRNVSSRPCADSVYDGRRDLVRRVEQLYATDFELYGY